jgi:hypothetical protein
MKLFILLLIGISIDVMTGNNLDILGGVFGNKMWINIGVKTLKKPLFLQTTIAPMTTTISLFEKINNKVEKKLGYGVDLKNTHVNDQLDNEVVHFDNKNITKSKIISNNITINTNTFVNKQLNDENSHFDDNKNTSIIKPIIKNYDNEFNQEHKYFDNNHNATDIKLSQKDIKILQKDIKFVKKVIVNPITYIIDALQNLTKKVEINIGKGVDLHHNFVNSQLPNEITHLHNSLTNHTKKLENDLLSCDDNANLHLICNECVDKAKYKPELYKLCCANIEVIRYCNSIVNITINF